MPGVTELDASVLVFVNSTASAYESECLGLGLDEVDDALVVQCQVLGKLSLLLPGENDVEVLVVPDRAVCIVSTRRIAGKSLVVVGKKLRQVGIGGLRRRQVSQPQLLYQPILKRQVSSLDPTFGLGRIRTQNVDIQLRESTPKLSDTRSFCVARARDAEDARLVAVEGPGLPWRSRYARVDVK